MTVSSSTISASADPVKPLESPGWQRHHWWGLIGMVFLGQLFLIFWLGDRTPAKLRQVQAPPIIRFTGPAWAEWLALQDPTLFALPHRRSFSGLAWQITSPPNLRADNWVNPARWPEPVVPPLAANFSGLQTPALTEANLVPIRPLPELRVTETVEQQLFQERSTLRIEGHLVDRNLLAPFQLPSWPNTNSDLLTNSIVQLAVDAEGWTASITLLCSSGSKEADLFALDTARKARFESLITNAQPSSPLLSGPWTWGQLIFQWHTTAETVTNAAPAARQ